MGTTQTVNIGVIATVVICAAAAIWLAYVALVIHTTDRAWRYGIAIRVAQSIAIGVALGLIAHLMRHIAEAQ